MIKINGITLDISDNLTSVVRDEVKGCLENDEYGIESIDFQKRDIIIDIGANVGIVSLYLAKKFPFIKIYSYEPIPPNYANLIKNLKNNCIENIKAYNFAITRDRRDLDMIIHPDSNSGGGTACLKDMRLPEHDYYKVKSISLDDIFIKNDIESCQLLKIDCEGCEHEILTNTNVLDKIDCLSAEFHINSSLENQGFSIERLKEHCAKYFVPEKMKIHSIQMAE